MIATRPGLLAKGQTPAADCLPAWSLHDGKGHTVLVGNLVSDGRQIRHPVFLTRMAFSHP